MAGDPRWLKLHFQEQCPNQGTELAGWENNSHRCGCCYCCFTGHHREPWWSPSHPNSDTLFFWVGTATSAPQKANTSVATHPTKIIEDSTSLYPSCSFLNRCFIWACLISAAWVTFLHPKCKRGWESQFSEFCFVFGETRCKRPAIPQTFKGFKKCRTPKKKDKLSTIPTPFNPYNLACVLLFH